MWTSGGVERLGMGGGVEELVILRQRHQGSGRDHRWVQDALLAILKIFFRIVLEKTPEKTKTMVCNLGFI